MNRLTPEDLDRDLRDFPVPPPPAGLLEKIQAEIPDAATLAGKDTTAAAAPRRWPLRLAATIALAAIGATVAWQVVKTRQGREFDRQIVEPLERPRRRRPTPERLSGDATAASAATGSEGGALRHRRRSDLDHPY